MVKNSKTYFTIDFFFFSSITNSINFLSFPLQVFDIGRIKRIAITGLEYLRVPGTNKYVVLVCTPERLYKFQETVRPEERSPFQAVFRAYTMESTDYLESSSVKFRASSAPTQLSRLCYDHANKFCRSFAVLTATDILCSEMDPWAETLANIVETRLIPFPECDTDDGQKSRLISPIAFAPTDFHALLVYADHLIAISLLDYSVVYEEHFGDHRFGNLLNVTRDEKTGNVYVYSTKAIFRMKVTEERRNVWKIYMDLGNMEYALLYAGDNPRHKDIVLSRTAERKFNSGLYIEAASFYAETMTSFETVCLKFLELREMDALRVFLRKKLFGLHTDEKTQITMLIVWLVELYLTEMARKGQKKEESSSGGLQKEFDDFMATPRVTEWTKKNPKVLYQLLASHGDCNNLLVSTMATAAGNDFEEAVNQLVQQQQWQEALKVMRAQRRPDLFYRFGPILMEAMPKETVAALKEQREVLEPNKLLPTLVCVDSATHVREVVQYLEFSIHSLGTTERAVHNYLIRLFAEHFKDRLKPYLETQGKDVSQLHYDRQYALRVCKQWHCNEACVFLQCLLGLWTDAVELALTFDVKLAQETANLPAEVELRRKLWLRIAKHEVEDRQADEVNVERALQLLKSCDLLRIEDILPLFADFEKIDHLKEAICEALQEYNLRIQEQKKDMEEAAKAAERVRKDLQTFRERALTIEVNDLCGSCAEYVLKRPCFVFPCGHKFHADCLERDWLQQSKEGGRLSILKQRMVTAEGTSEFAKHRAAYEDLLAGECLFCGQLMIEAIDQPLVEDWDRVTSDWE